MKKGNLELFESEWAILQKVWELEPCAAPTVQEAIRGEKGWAYTTVKTMMDRIRNLAPGETPSLDSEPSKNMMVINNNWNIMLKIPVFNKLFSRIQSPPVPSQ